MKTFTLGAGLNVDLATLIDSRLLVQANSGGGKSRTIRRLLEQTHGAVQHLVIDLEGEFASLREKFDYVVAAKGGDTPADPRSAALLAERLLELKVSAILDIYELKHDARIRFVRLFLEALVNARKDLWHPALVIVDEAHVFCPEQGEAESASAVIDVCTRGRKRGFCVVLATQRLSKLHKDAAAECNNKLIGRTGLDVDMKRAAYELGFTSQEQRLSLRNLAAGEFYAFGPALSREVTKVLVGDVTTSHPKAGSSRMAFSAPPPTDKVRALLPQLADLPAEVEQRELTQKELKTAAVTADKRAREAERLAAELQKRLEAQAGQPKATKRDEDRAGRIVELKQQLAQRERALEDAMKILIKIKAVDFSARGGEALEQAVTEAVKQITSGIEKRVTAMADRVQGIQAQASAAEEAITKLLNERIDLTVTVQKQAPYAVSTAVPREAIAVKREPSQAPVNGELTKAEQRVVDAVGWWRGAAIANPSRHQVAFVAGYTVNGHFNNLVGGLRSKGVLDYPPKGGVALTDAGVGLWNATADVPTREGLIDKVLQVLEPSPGRIFKIVAEAGRDLTREELAELAGYTVNGHFNNMVGSLRSLGVIEYPRQGGVTLGEMFSALS